MSAPFLPRVLPLPREDGYWTVDKGRLTFVYFARPTAQVLSLPDHVLRGARLREKIRRVQEKNAEAQP